MSDIKALQDEIGEMWKKYHNGNLNLQQQGELTNEIQLKERELAELQRTAEKTK